MVKQKRKLIAKCTFVSN